MSTETFSPSMGGDTASPSMDAYTNSSGSIGGSDTEKFHWADYLVFVLSLVLTAAVGLFAAFWKRKNSDSQELLVASRSLHWFPVSLSMIGSVLNGLALIGGPAEVYYFGVVTQWASIGYILIPFVAAHLVLPTFLQLRLTSAYEYLELRFNYALRATASLLFALSLLLFLAAVLYAPALAFSQVTSLNLSVCIVLTGAICTVYTGLGGMRAVVWTDTIQMVILIVGMIVLVVVGTEKDGGVHKVWNDALEGGRLEWKELSPDPRIRKTIWSFFGMWIIYIGNSFSNQMLIQRYLAVKSLKDAKKAMYGMWIVGSCVAFLMCITGIFMYSHFKDCDPLLAKKISKPDQVVPYYLMLTLGEYHGLPGVFTAAVFAAALSSVSSAVNSLAAMTLEDFIKPGYKYFKGTHLRETLATRLTIILAFAFGILTIALSFVAEHMTDILIEAAPRIWSMVGGPLAGVFIMGFYFPWVNSWGAFAGLLSSVAFALWLGVGNLMYAVKDIPLPLGMECLTDEQRPQPRMPAPPPGGELQDFYQISYMWFGVFNILACLIVGNVVSLITYTCCKRRQKPEKFARDLYYPCATELLCCCPDSIKYNCPCGVSYEEEDPTLTKYHSDATLTKHPSKDLEMDPAPISNGMINVAFDNTSTDGYTRY